MNTISRHDDVPSREQTIVFNYFGPDPIGPYQSPTKTFVASFPGYTRNFEKKTLGGNGRGRWNNFQHYKSVAGIPMNSLLPWYTTQWGDWPHCYKSYCGDVDFGYHLWWDGSELWPYGSPGSLNKGLPPLFADEDTEGGFIPDPPELSKLNAMALNAMMPGIKAELSLINSIIELKDFKSLAKKVLNIRAALPRAIHQVKRWLEVAASFKSNRWTLRTLSRSGADGFLQWNFAWAPLLSDIASVQEVIKRTERRMNELVTRAGRAQRRHFTYRWREFNDVVAYNKDDGYCYDPSRIHSSFPTFDTLRYVTYEPTTFHAEIEYSYTLTQYQVEHARVLSILDALGVNLNPSIIWNAIPWTFVVDWVAGVSSWLSSMTTRNMEPQVNIRRYLWSVSRKRRINAFKGMRRTYGRVTAEARCPMPEMTETAYKRSAEIPDWSSFYMSGLSPKELSLGASLVIARRGRYKHW
jgi:hypothetical protein